MAKGYLVVEVEVTDREAFDRYRSVALPVLARYEGRLIVNNGKMESLEGGWAPASLLIVEFPSYEQARAFYFSTEYQVALPMRLAASNSKAVLIEGPSGA